MDIACTVFSGRELEIISLLADLRKEREGYWERLAEMDMDEEYYRLADRAEDIWYEELALNVEFARIRYQR